MQAKTNVITALVLVGASYFTFYVYQPKQADKITQEFLLKGKNIENITRLDVQTKEHGSYHLSKKNKELWELDANPYAILDDSAVNEILDAVVSLRLTDPLPKEELDSDMGTYGLKEPEGKISVTTDDNNTREIHYGSKNDYTGDRYLKLSAQPEIYLNNSLLFSATDKKADELRDKTLISFIDADIKSFSYKSEQNTVEISQEKEATWKIKKPQVLKEGLATASTDTVTKITRALRNLKITNFYDAGETAPYSLEDFKTKASWVGTLEFSESSKKSPITLKIIRQLVTEYTKNPQSDPHSAAPPTQVQREYLYGVLNENPTILKFDPVALSLFDKTPEELRERRFLPLDPSEVTEFSTTGTLTADIKGKLENDTWTINGKPGDRAFVEQLFKDIDQLNALSFPTADVDFGFNAPSLKISLTLKEGKQRTLVLGSKIPSGVGYYAATDDLKEPFIVAEASIKALTPKEESFLKVTP